MKITIEPYNPKWRTEFKKEQTLLLDSIEESGIRIEHIGSTSVEGLAAKPVIDIMIGINDFKTAGQHIKTIENLGYRYIPDYEDVMPCRRFFIKESNGNRTHHIHMVALDSDFWKRHLKFRDHLRVDEEDRNKYQEFKIKLAKKNWNNRDDYTDAKSEIIKKILKKVE
ncbi:MAG: GrpB family protein [Bacteroidota bacterium]